MSSSSVLLYIPETGIYPYLRGLSVLGDALQKNGGQVYISRCTGQMLRCSMLAMNHLSVNANADDKSKLCQLCDDLFTQAQEKYRFRVIDLVSYVDEKLYRKIDNILNIQEEHWKEIAYKGFPVGKVAEYDFSLESKCVVYPNMSDSHRQIYASYIKNTILALELGERIFRSHNLNLVLTFNPYAQCQGICFSANTMGVGWNTLTYPTHFNADTSKFLICKSMSLHLIMQHISRWNNEKNTPILPEYVRECWDDTIYRVYQPGSHIFSGVKSANPDSIFNSLNLNSQLKTLVVYTSSYDELAGLESIMNVWGENVNIIHAFPTQIEWLQWLRKYTIKRSDIQVIVRIHPREGGRQFGFGSKHLVQLKEAFPANADRFQIIWPDDPISSYDLMELADLCLVPWTAMGLEAARVGIPVLAYTGNMYYPDDDFVQVAINEAEYEKRLKTMIEQEYVWTYLVKAVRFYHWRTFLPTLNMGETVPQKFDDITCWPAAPRELIPVVEQVLSDRQDLFQYNIQEWKNKLTPDSQKLEDEAMREGVRRFLDKIFYPPVVDDQPRNFMLRIIRFIYWKFTGETCKFERKYQDFTMKYSEDISRLPEYKLQTLKNTRLRIFVEDFPYVVLVHKGQTIRRRSIMVKRLAKLGSEN